MSDNKIPVWDWVTNHCKDERTSLSAAIYASMDHYPHIILPYRYKHPIPDSEYQWLIENVGYQNYVNTDLTKNGPVKSVYIFTHEGDMMNFMLLWG